MFCTFLCSCPVLFMPLIAVCWFSKFEFMLPGLSDLSKTSNFLNKDTIWWWLASMCSLVHICRIVIVIDWTCCYHIYVDFLGCDLLLFVSPVRKNCGSLYVLIPYEIRIELARPTNDLFIAQKFSLTRNQDLKHSIIVIIKCFPCSNR